MVLSSLVMTAVRRLGRRRFVVLFHWIWDMYPSSYQLSLYGQDHGRLSIVHDTTAIVTMSVAEVLCAVLHVPLFQVNALCTEAEPLLCVRDMRSAHMPHCSSVMPPYMIIKFMDAFVCCELCDPESEYYPLRALVTYEQQTFLSNEMAVQFVVHQLVECVRFLCTQGVVPVDLSLDCFMVDRRLHVRADIVRIIAPYDQQHTTTDEETDWMRRPLWHATDAWVRGQLCNFEYLRVLNAFAGRTRTNPSNQPIYPWVADFTLSESGWRDLSKTKYRHCKGDEHLELSYSQPSQSHPPHHVPELLSDIGYYIYKWVPAEYPGSMVRLYECSPDECIEEFYSDPTIFHSVHDDMLDLELPEWCEASGQVFIGWHRRMLDCEWVAHRLNHWIDLVFGYKLSGEAAIAAKNVHLPASHCHGVAPVQLFHKAHPVFKGNHDNNNKSCVSVEHMHDAVLNPLYEMPQQHNHFTNELQETDVFSSLEYIYRQQPDHASFSPLRLALQELGCVLTELGTAHHFRCLPTQPTLHDHRLTLARQLNSRDNASWPQLQRSVNMLLKHDTMFSAVQVPRRTRLCDVLQPVLNTLQLPICHSLLADWLVQEQHLRHSMHACLCDEALDLNAIESLNSSRVHAFRQLSAQLLPAVSKLSGGLDWLFAFADDMLCSGVLQAEAIPALLSVFCPYMGKQQAAHKLARCLKQAYDVDRGCCPDYLVVGVLYQEPFAHQLCHYVGAQSFLEAMLPQLIEACSGLRDARLHSQHEHLARVLLAAHEHDPLPDELMLHRRLSTSSSQPEAMFSLDNADEASEADHSLTSACDTTTDVRISSAAQHTLMCLAESLGPVLTARYITNNLLRMLALI